MSRPRAADDFASIRARLAELRRETAKSEERKHVNLQGEEVGSCGECESACIPCSGKCSFG